MYELSGPWYTIAIRVLLIILLLRLIGVIVVFLIRAHCQSRRDTVKGQKLENPEKALKKPKNEVKL